jgi:hypothetical protein
MLQDAKKKSTMISRAVTGGHTIVPKKTSLLSILKASHSQSRSTTLNQDATATSSFSKSNFDEIMRNVDNSTLQIQSKLEAHTVQLKIIEEVVDNVLDEFKEITSTVKRVVRKNPHIIQNL